ncbi:MAG: Electron transfer flavoprotein subunit alpha, partial [Nocardioides sp.]|nr:Electron transfer flavoprotein subunit alpha [Nocardioides sp.]
MILVLVETDASGAVEVSLEAVTFARGLAAEGGGVAIDAVIVGAVACGTETLVEQLGSYGVRHVHHA